MRGKAAKGKPLSPAAKRDSIVVAQKVDHVLDSLAAAKTAPQPVIDRIKKALSSGEGFGAFFRGGSGAPPGVFVERPGESPLPRRRGPRPGAEAHGDTTLAQGRRAGGMAAGEAGAGGPGGEPPIDQAVLSEVFTALRSSGALQGGGFGRRNQAPLVETGDYLVSITANGQTMKQVLRVDRVSGGDGSAVADDASDLDP